MFNILFRIVLFCGAGIFILSITSCDTVKGSGDIVKEIRNETDFHAIDISIAGHVELYQGSTWKVEIEIEETILPYLETEVRNGRLDIYFSRHVHDVDDLKIKITAPMIDAIDLNGSGNLIAFDSLSGSKLTVDISGSGDADLRKVYYDELKLDLSGSGNLQLQGESLKAAMYVSGSGNLNASDCQIKVISVDASGSGDIRCRVSDQLKGNISGSGNVYYDGNPVTDVDVSGSGRLKKM
jgi:Putative auto-transporter adhesin, head GIN domain